MERCQQFVFYARDERGDGVADYMIEVMIKKGETWTPFNDMYTDVHAYGPIRATGAFTCACRRALHPGSFN